MNDIDGIEWIRLLYLYPTTITNEVIDAIADLDKVVKYIDLPLQHASDAVLKRMKRPGTRKSYVRLLDNIRARIPNVALRTTFIVGFPGETAEDFAELEGFIEEIGFDHVGVFTYSHEEGTSAHDLADDVPAATKKKRQDRLMARQRDIVDGASASAHRRTDEVGGRWPITGTRARPPGPPAGPGPRNRPGCLPDRVRPLADCPRARSSTSKLSARRTTT